MIIEKVKELFFIKHVRNWYAKFERPISSFSLVGGFVFDALTLKRVDTLWENIWVLGHLLVVAIAIILINKEEGGDISAKDPARLHFWLVNILQFFFGGLLSTYLVFYFRSGTLSTSWPFILILVLAFWANESLKRHFVRVTFQISLFFLSIFSFAIFLVPVVLHDIGPELFIVSGAISLIVIVFFIQILNYVGKKRSTGDRIVLSLSIGFIYVLMNVLYFGNFIPPIPLSLKDSGIYHSIIKNPDGNYKVEYEEGVWWDFFNPHDNFHVTPIDSVYAYSAIFSPSSFKMNMIHEWQKYNKLTKNWDVFDKVNLSVIGGRDGGYRTYSVKEGLTPGEWRVNVKTPTGQLIGRLRFTIVYPEIDLPHKFLIKT